MSFGYVDDETSASASSTRSSLLEQRSSPSDPEKCLMPESSVSNSLPNSNQPHRVSTSMSPNTQLEHEKRVRREIANSNERRRMQSINTGFQSLKILIPHSCGEKLSKACILQRAADHIKALENEKIKLQSQNEQFRILIKSFQIDSTSVLQAQRRLSTNDSDESVLLLNNESKAPTSDDDCHRSSSSYSDVKQRHSYHSTWHPSDSPHYPSTSKDDPSYYSSSSYRTNPSFSSKSASNNPESNFLLVQPSATTPTPSHSSQRVFKSSSLDQSNENGMTILDRCSLRAPTVDNSNSSPTSNLRQHPVSRRNLQTIVEAIRHLEGDEALANISSSISSVTHHHHHHHHQDDLPAQIKAMIQEKFHQQTSKSTSFYPPATTTTSSSLSHEIDLHQKPPKKRKITFNENDDFIEQPLPIPKQEIVPISSPDLHHHETISNDCPSMMADDRFLHPRSHPYHYSSRHPN